VLFIGAIFFINHQVTIIQNTQDQLIDTRMPTVLAGENLLDGVHHSLAGLRGYMILGGNKNKGVKLKAERAEGWAKIDSMLGEYDRLSVNWTEPANLECLSAVKSEVEEFRTAQQEVEDIAHAPNNLPATNILLTKAAPTAKKISSAITAIIDEESTLEATFDRKALLKLFADSRGSFVGGLASIRAYLLSGNEDFKKDFIKKWDINETRFKQISKQTALLSSIQKVQWDIYSKQRVIFAPLPLKMFAIRGGEGWNQANYLLATKAAPHAGKIKTILSKLADSQYSLKIQAIESLKYEKQVLSTVGSTIATVSAILSISIAFLLSRSLSNKLDEMVGVAHQLSLGDLRFTDIKAGSFKEFNTLAKALNNTKGSLRGLISNVLRSSGDLSVHTEKLEALLINSQKTADKQQENTHTIVNSMQEMTQAVEAVSSNTVEAANSAEDADASTSTGHDVVSKTVTSITELAAAIENAANTINQLGEETHAVDTILSAISGIADQTNLLALNAAIEAARAGEQGRGFAVVADEVRALAARTQESTIEIRTMLDRLKVGASNAVDVMSTGHQQAQESVEKANVASKTLESIAKEMKVIKGMNAQIASAAEQQDAVNLDMKSKVARIDEGASEVSDASKQSMQSIQEISTLMDVLGENVDQFKI